MENRECLVNAVEKFSQVNCEMIDAIETYVKKVTNEGEKVVSFKGEIDCASCEPIVKLTYSCDDDSTYAVSDCEDFTDLSDLTGNELFEICNHLMAKNYLLA